MPKFMDVHTGFEGASAEDLQAAHQADLEIQGEHGVSFDHAWLDPKSGKAFCLSTGPDLESVKRVHAAAGHPADEYHEISVEV